MSDTCGPMSATPSSPYAQWSPSLRTWTDTGLLGLTLCLGTLPKWGCLHGGELYELPTPERPTDARESSSLLKTPHAGLGERGRDGVYANPKGQQDLQHQIATDLLPTPRASEANHSGRMATNHLGQTGLAEAVNVLLPTPRATDGTDAPANLTPSVVAILNGSMGRTARLSEMAMDWSIGESTPPLSDAGSPSSDDPLLLPLFPAPTDDHD